MNNAASNSGLINVPQAEHLAVVILPQHLRSPELENTRSLPRFFLHVQTIETDRLDQLQPPTSEKLIPVIKPSSSGACSPYV